MSTTVRESTPEQERLWDARDVAQYIGCNPKYVFRTDIPRVRVGGLVRFIPADVRAFVEARRTVQPQAA